MRRPHVAVSVIVLCTLLPACGPLAIPMVHRLPEDEQRQVDAAWNNMLAPPGRLSRQTMLDTLIAFQGHERGVDRLVFRSEKTFTGGTVVMEIFFERANQKVDRYDVSIYDPSWNLQRRESYRTAEVEQAIHDLCDSTECHVKINSRELPPSPEMIARKEAREARMRAVIAATQRANQVELPPQHEAIPK